MKKYNFLLKYIVSQKINLFVLFVCVGITTILQIYSPNIISIFIDKLIGHADKDELLGLIGVYTALIFINMGISAFITFISQIIGWNLTNKLREHIVKKCIKFDMQFHKEKTQGKLIEIIDNDVNNLFNFFSYMGVSLLCNTTLFIGVIIACLYENLIMGMSQLLFACLALFLLNKIRIIGIKYKRKIRDYQSEAVSRFGEAITNTEDIAGNGLSTYIYEKLLIVFKDWMPNAIVSSKIGWSMIMVTLALQAIGYANCFIIGTVLWKKGIISIGTIYLFYSYTKYILSPINELQNQMLDLQNVNASIQRISELISDFNDNAMELDLSDSVTFFNEIHHNDSIEFENVSFKYDQVRYVLKGIKLNIEPNTVLGIIGKTGSGKTTLASLLVRLHDNYEGDILIGNRNIKNFNINVIRQQIIYITQGVQFINGTLRDNITFYDKSISDSKIYESIDLMGINEIFDKFDKGLDTEIKTNELALSSGESQLIAFLRAFVRNPKVVILDEVTSKIDSITEDLLMIAIKNLLKNRIGIIIAHKLQTINLTNNIVILKDGRIVEQGKTKELMVNTESFFYHFWSSTKVE